MSGAFSWLGDIFGALLKFFPRRTIVRTTHAGVSFRKGKEVRLIEPGIIWYWPLITEIEVIPVVRQSINMPMQTLITKDGQTVAVSGVIVYEVRDVVAACTRQFDFDETIEDISLMAMTRVVCAAEYETMRQDLENVGKDLTRELRRDLNQYGLKIQSAALTDMMKTRAFTLIQVSE